MAQVQGFDISRFNALLNSRGVQRNNKFLVRFPIPILMKQFSKSFGDLSSDARNLEFYTDSASLPGTTIATHSVLRYGMGLTEEKPFMGQVNPVKFTHIVDAVDNQAYLFFRTWMKLIFNSNLANGIRTVSGSAQDVFELSYKYEYVTDINILVFNDQGDITRNVILRDAYPKAIDDLPLNWADNQATMKLSSTVVFQDFFEQDLEDKIQQNNVYGVGVDQNRIDAKIK